MTFRVQPVKDSQREVLLREDAHADLLRFNTFSQREDDRFDLSETRLGQTEKQTVELSG